MKGSKIPWKIYPIAIIQTVSGKSKIYEGPTARLAKNEMNAAMINIALFSIPFGTY